jgi:predicted nucleic acid-binding protein
MIVVADTSPLNYLIQIGCESLLPVLYTRVMIPPAVLAELGDPAAPSAVGQWLLRVPEWIEVKRTSSPPDTGLAALDPGEQEAIQLAEEQHADLL